VTTDGLHWEQRWWGEQPSDEIGDELVPQHYGADNCCPTDGTATSQSNLCNPSFSCLAFHLDDPRATVLSAVFPYNSGLQIDVRARPDVVSPRWSMTCQCGLDQGVFSVIVASLTTILFKVGGIDLHKVCMAIGPIPTSAAAKEATLLSLSCLHNSFHPFWLFSTCSTTCRT
jgi:hypothetical protein